MLQTSIQQSYQDYLAAKLITDELKSLAKTADDCLLTFGTRIAELSENDTELALVEQNQHQDNNLETALVDRIVHSFQDVFIPVKHFVTQVRDHNVWESRQ